MKIIFALSLLSIFSFAEYDNVRIYTPQDRVTKEWVQEQATKDPSSQYFWRESPTSVERIRGTAPAAKTETHSSGPIYEDQIHSYDSRLPSTHYVEGQRVPEYDRLTGVMRWVPATYRYVQERAAQDPGTNYFYSERKSEPSREMLRYQSGEHGDKYLSETYEKYRSEGYGTKYQMPSKSIIEHEAKQSREAAERKNVESLWGKPLNSLPSRPR